MERLALLRNCLVLEVFWAVLGEGKVVKPACRGRGIKMSLRHRLCLQLILLEYMGDDRATLAFLAYGISIFRDTTVIYGSCAPE